MTDLWESPCRGTERNNESPFDQKKNPGVSYTYHVYETSTAS